VTCEIARLTDGDVVGIDIDASAIAAMTRRIEADGLGHRIEVLHVSLDAVRFPDESFDVLWAEGVLHLLDPGRSLPVCRRLLKPGGFLVMHETVAWFEAVRDGLKTLGFSIFNQLLLPAHVWWTDYYAPLAARIRTLRSRDSESPRPARILRPAPGDSPGLRLPSAAPGGEHGDGPSSDRLAQHEREIAMVKANPDRYDSGFYILQRS
jgi:SAM-dependent methyltransferase